MLHSPLSQPPAPSQATATRQARPAADPGGARGADEARADVPGASPSALPSPAAPRLYHAHAPLWGALEGAGTVWPSELDRVADLGFTHLLLAPIAQPGKDGDVQAPADHDALHPALGDGPTVDALAAVRRLAQARGLTLFIDLPLARVSAQGRLATSQGSWLQPRPATAIALDPRRALTAPGQVPLAWHDAAARDGLVPWATALMQRCIDAGVQGFFCEPVAAADGLPWAELIGAARRHAPGTRFLAWTPGLAHGAMPALATAGFDGAFSSLPWWDFQADWLLDEQRALLPFGDVIALADSLYGPRCADQGEAAARRALWAAAATGDGLLVPMGFEHGWTDPLDPRAAGLDTWGALRDEGGLDLHRELQQANAWQARHGAPYRGSLLRRHTGAGAALTVLSRTAPRANDAPALVLALNPVLHRAASIAAGPVLADIGTAPARLLAGDGTGTIGVDGRLALGPGGVALQQAVPAEAVTVSPPTKRTLDRKAAEAALDWPRIAIEQVTPQCDGGRFAVRRMVGDTVRVEADAWMDGHDKLALAVRWRALDSEGWQETRMRPLLNDRWVGFFPLDRLGRHEFTVEAWRDSYGTWAGEIEKKHAAGVDVTLELEEGRMLVAEAVERGGAASDPALVALAARLAPATAGKAAKSGKAGKAARGVGGEPGGSDTKLTPALDADARLAALLDPAVRAAMDRADPQAFLARHPQTQRIEAERLAARFGSWYELFPRSAANDGQTHGTFDDVIGRLPSIRAMGFDVLYFPPIHPIGRAHRKGRNNSLVAGPDDPGSPYAIGSEDGGHDALHPQLGTFDDFARMRDAAAAHGMELALDFAIQCSPDHPWLRDNKAWFAFRPDGTVKYAENPPKKYEDIVNVDFYSERTDAKGKRAAPELWMALRDVVLFWVSQGVKLFRVDNPHTKPLPFWEWMIGDVRGRHPDVIFLAEAFTRPKMMARLAKLGFSQSYTYFTWRNDKRELTEYLTELNAQPLRETYGPHFFVNTPDINPYFLQRSGRPSFLIRASLATLLSGLWGMYNGFELCEALPHVVGGKAKEEYGDSEKYQLRAWDWQQPGNIVAEIARLNSIRLANPALHSHLGLHFVEAHDDQVLAFAKSTEAADGDADRFGDNVIVAAVNLDPQQAHETTFELPLWRFGLPDDASVEVEDLMTGQRLRWQGKWQRVRLDPHQMPFAVWRVQPLEETT